jgi:hypothetical protein
MAVGENHFDSGFFKGVFNRFDTKCGKQWLISDRLFSSPKQ